MVGAPAGFGDEVPTHPELPHPRDDPGLDRRIGVAQILVPGDRLRPGERTLAHQHVQVAVAVDIGRFDEGRVAGLRRDDALLEKVPPPSRVQELSASTAITRSSEKLPPPRFSRQAMP